MGMGRIRADTMVGREAFIMLDGEKIGTDSHLTGSKKESEVIDIFLALQPHDQAEVISLLTPRNGGNLCPF